jgi:hypothetical protein
MIIKTPTEMVGVIDCLAKGCISDAKWAKILASKKRFIKISMANANQ